MMRTRTIRRTLDDARRHCESFVQVDTATPTVAGREPLVALRRNFRRRTPVQGVVIEVSPLRGGSAGDGHE
jgi:hypothetical protein